MRVKLIACTPNILDVLYTSARTCYNAGSPIDMWEDVENIQEDKKLKLIKSCIESGHHSVLEHAYFTFSIESITRACSHQLVRHRLCSFSQQSQRYCEFKNGVFDNVEPPKIAENSDAHVIYDMTMRYISQAYDNLIKLGILPEDARSVLPNSCCTNINMTLNLRELIHLCEERLCTHAQSEIRQMCKSIKKCVVEQENWLQEYLQPKCVRIDKCTEHKSCGFIDAKNKL